MSTAPIGIFDSGRGGLSVLRACRDLLPAEDFAYACDARAGGWGGLPEEKIAERVHACVDRLRAAGCKAIVAACNTATEVGIAELRRTYSLPFVGVEPAVLPAVRAFPRGNVLVLCTPATARQRKFSELLAKCPPSATVRVRPQDDWAALVEKNFFSLDCLAPRVYAIVDEERPDAVVLGCTHYVFLRYLFEERMGAERVFDGNEGVAKRLRQVLDRENLLSAADTLGTISFYKAE